RSITEQKTKILALNRQLASLNQERTDLRRELWTGLEMLSTVAAGMGSRTPTTKLCLDTDSAKDQSESSPDDPEMSDQEQPDQESSDHDNSDQDQPDRDPDYTPPPDGSDRSSSNDKRQNLPPDHKKDLDREEVPDNYDMGGGSDVEKPPDPGHAILDELLEKDRGAASPVLTPGPRYLSYEKDGSGVPASSDPASKSKSKSRSTGDPKPSKDANLDTGDQASDTDTSAESDNDESLDDMLQAQTLMALSRSISEQRRRDHTDLIAPVLTELEILNRVLIQMQTRQYNIADMDPWVVQRINTLTMTLAVLSRALPFRPETPATSWLNVLTGGNIPESMSFEITVDGCLGFLMERYSAVEFQDLIAYWESTHRFPFSPGWKQILQPILIAMREGWCDLELLLDPYFLHFPKRTDEVAWYPGIEARSANLADPQLHHHLIDALAEM
ncbi:hypothetical protein PHMEG_00019493, partial [Phytophthora megakarya]